MELLSDYVRIGASAGIYLLAIFGWGHFIWRFPDKRLWDYILSRLIVGCAAIYALFLALSAVGYLFRIPVGIILLVGLVGGVAAISSLVKKGRPQLDRIERALGIAIALLVVLQMACGLTPLIFDDLQVYQLAAPSQFLQQGSLVEIPWNVLTNSPMALQLTLGMSLAIDSYGAVTKLLLTIFGCLLPLAVSQLFSSRKASLLAALFVLCYPEFWAHQTFGVIDLTVAAFLVLGAGWTRRAIHEGEWRWAVLAGCAFGFVIGSRYQGIVLVIWIPAALLLERVWQKRGIERSLLLKLTSVALIAGLFVAPWLIRNVVHFGNPVYPLLSGIFDAPGWSVVQAERLKQEVFGPQLSELPPVRWVIAPISPLITMPSNGLFGISVIFGAVLALFVSGDAKVKTVAVLGIGGLILWSALQPTPNAHLMRFNAASTAFLLAATAGVLADDGIWGDRGIRAGTVLAGGSLVIALFFLQSIMPVGQTLLSSTQRTTVWRANVPSWEAYDVVNSELDPERNKVLVIGETRGFWLRIPYLLPSVLDAPRLDEVFSGSDEKAWRKKIEDLGVTHLLISYPEWDRFRDGYDYLRRSPEEMERLNAWFRTLPVLFDDKRGTLVLALGK